MKTSTKAALIGGVVGTLLMGPGLGTVIGAAVGLRRYFETKSPDHEASNDNSEEPADHYSSAR